LTGCGEAYTPEQAAGNILLTFFSGCSSARKARLHQPKGFAGLIEVPSTATFADFIMMGKPVENMENVTLPQFGVTWLHPPTTRPDTGQNAIGLYNEFWGLNFWGIIQAGLNVTVLLDYPDEQIIYSEQRKVSFYAFVLYFSYCITIINLILTAYKISG